MPDKRARRTRAEINDKPAYDNWRREIDLYREAAGARLTKAKPLAPA